MGWLNADDFYVPGALQVVESVFAQGYSELEYWIIDGDSTDGTKQYLAGLERQGARVLSEPDRGIADAMNKGIRLASGEWIGCCEWSCCCEWSGGYGWGVRS